MCFPCETGGATSRAQPVLPAAQWKQRAEEAPGASVTERRREARFGACLRPGAAQKLIKSFVESY